MLKESGTEINLLVDSVNITLLELSTRTIKFLSVFLQRMRPSGASKNTTDAEVALTSKDVRTSTSKQHLA